ncbi:MAG TPA: cation:dicarboxylase symporter family transporter [Thermoanaerobaculia bacterium]|nr:cation:dicarboxylase symporter family transporter [Thermoanaerobaculia bacterium]
MIALAAALVLGTWGHWSGAPAFTTLEQILKPIGALWMAALKMVVLPLVVLKLLAAIVSAPSRESVGWLGLRTLLLFAAMLASVALLTLLIAPPFVAMYDADPATLASLRSNSEMPKAANSGGSSSNQLLPTLLFTAAFALAITRLPDDKRLPITTLLQGLSTAMFTVVRWILIGTPVGVFALTYSPALHAGAGAAGMFGAFIVLVSGLLLLFTLLLYPATALFGRVSMLLFAKAVAPAQLVAVSTRSSIASLPALIEGAVRHLRLPATATSFVLPLTVAIFKLNRTISSMAKLLFVAHVYNVKLSVETIVIFVATVMLLSFSSAGVPDGGAAFATLPAYLAAGLPMEGVVILEATNTIPDIFKTLLNVTGDMSAATILSRSTREAAPLDEGIAIEDAA